MPTADYIIDCMRVCTMYAKLLVEDIPPDQFSHLARPDVNHACFCIGHQAIYPNRVLELLGRADLVAERDGYADLFEAGNTCVEQDGRYPSKDELMAYYFDRHTAVEEALRGIDEAVFARENPAEGRIREMCPTIGAAVNFLLVAHHMAHLGQVSIFRRLIGLPSAM